MSQSHYSLRWNNHQSHILSAFDALLQAETLVDVTLVCAESSVRAHKVVLSACSPFFQRIFAENPCKHPVIVLKDFSGWEVQAIVDFMYKGEISVVQEQLQSLIKAAESLQVRGLVHQEDGGDADAEGVDRASLGDADEHDGCGGVGGDADERSATASPIDFASPTTAAAAALVAAAAVAASNSVTPTTAAAAAAWLTMGERAESPLPRRKQARPRRRSGEMMTPQDLSTCAKAPPAASPDHHLHLPPAPAPLPLPPPPPQPPALSPPTHVENLSLKKSKLDLPPAAGSPHAAGNYQTTSKEKDKENHRLLIEDKKNKLTFQGQFIQQSLLPLQQQQQHQHQSHHHHHHHHQQAHHHHQQQQEEERAKLVLTPDPSGSPELDLSMHHHKEFPPSPPLLPPSMLNMKHELDGHSPLPFPPMPSVSALTMTPPHSKFFGLDSPLLFPPGLDGCRNPLLELADPRTTPETQMYTKKKMGRPKGQHSAPRGGPPRSWTNAELTEALQHVWNKKMTTSQASRIFGIPYNSLLMYVRGKYGKSLKLEQLRKDCIGGPVGMDLMNLSGGGGAGSGGPGANNNNNVKNNDHHHHHHHDTQRPSSADHAASGGGGGGGGQHPLFNPFAPSFYPDFAAAAGGFPIPVSMIHLLPQSEKNRDHYLGMPPGSSSSGGGGAGDLDDCGAKPERGMKEEPQDLFLPPGLSRDDRREQLVQQNGQD